MHPGDVREREVGVSTNVFDAGEGITNLTGGGGGWGDPLLRDPEKVAQDVIDGFVTVDRAKSDYGVVLAVNTLEVDQEATVSLRQQLGSVGA